MQISRIKLRNWKNFKELEAHLGNRVFLIGPNASGKSNLLDVFRFLKELANDGLRKAVEDERGGVSAIRCLVATRYNYIDVEVDVSTTDKDIWTYQLIFGQDNLKRPIVNRERVMKNGNTLVNRPNEQDRLDPVLLTQTAMEQISVNQPFREVAEFLKTITYQHLLPQVVRNPRSFSPMPVQNDPYGRDFLLRIWKTNAKTRDSRLKKIGAALKIAVPQFTELQVEMDDAGIPHLMGSYSHWRPHGAKQNENRFSDGTLRLLGLLWTIFEGSGPLLLEEPEISLHPELVQRLPAIFNKVMSGRKEHRQIIISTHSEKMLSDPGIGPEEVLRLEPSDNGTVLKQTDEADRQAMQAGLTAADVLMPKAAPADISQLSLWS
jgi:predicted ATPase